MANSEIGGLTSASTLDGDESIHMVQDGNSRKATAQDIADLSSTKGWHTISLPVAGMKAQDSNGAADFSEELATNDIMVDGAEFTDSTKEYRQCFWVMPSSWDGGVIRARIHWKHGSGGTSFGVSWFVAAVGFKTGDALDASFGTEVEINDTGGTADQLEISPISGDITVAGSGLAGGSAVWFRLARDPADGNDDLDISAIGVILEILYQTNAEKDTGA